MSTTFDSTEAIKKGYTVDDLACHGRKIEHTAYKQLWINTLRLLSQFSNSLLYNNLGKADVRFSVTLVPTACINMKTKEIFLNPKFIRTVAFNPNRLAGLLLHELIHPIIEPVDPPANDWFHNVFTDALINSTIYRLNPVLCELMVNSYDEESFPSILLRPRVRTVWAGAVRKKTDPNFKVVYAYNTLPLKKEASEEELAENSKTETENDKKPGDFDESYATLMPKVDFSHLDVYKNLYPQNQQEHEQSVRPSYTELLNRFYPNLEQIREQIKKKQVYIIVEGDGGDSDGAGNPIDEGDIPEGATVIRVKSSLSGTLKDTLNQSELENLPEEVKEAVKNAIDKMKEKFGKEPGESDPSSNKEGGSNASKTGNLTDRISSIAKKEEVFSSNLKKDKNHRIRNAKILLAGLKPDVKKRVLGNNNDGLSDKFAAVDNFDLDSEVVSAFDAASHDDVTGKILNTLNPRRRQNKSILPFNLKRSGAALLSMGYMPVFWKRTVKSPDPALRATDLYIDFSGSMYSYIPKVLRLIIEMQSSCSSSLFAFSTEVHPTNIDDIKAGRYKSTGGTDFNTVLNHFINENENSKCLFITDGQDYVSPEMIANLESSKKKVYMLFVGPEKYSKDLKEQFPWCEEVFFIKM